ncbi:hypothetical protein [Hungatella sp. SB206]
MNFKTRSSKEEENHV